MEIIMKNQLISKVSAVAYLACFLLGTSLNAHAFGLDSLGVGGSSSSVDTSKLVDSSKEMVKQYMFSMKAINYAQAEALDAFGLGKDAEAARQDAKAFESGVVNDAAGEKRIANTEKRNNIINEKTKKGTKLQGEARKHLAKSAVGYAGGSYASVKILENMKKWSSEAQGAMSSLSSDPMKLASFKDDIAAGLFVMSKLPGLSSQWVKTSSALINYAAINGDKIDISKEEKRISGELGLM